MTLNDIVNKNDLFERMIFKEDFEGILNCLNCPIEIFSQNSKVENGKSKFEELLKKNFCNVFIKNVNFKTIKNFTWMLAISIQYCTENKKGITIKLPLDVFFLDLLYIMTCGEIYDDAYEKAENKTRFLKTKFINIRDLFIDVRDNGITSKNYAYVGKFIMDYCTDDVKNKFKQKLNNKRIRSVVRPGMFAGEQKEIYFDAIIEDFNSLITSIDKLENECTEIFNTNDFLECFDYDKFMLMLAYTLVSYFDNKYNEEKIKYPDIDPVVQLLFVYYDAIKIIQNNDKDYNPCFYHVEEKRNVKLNDFVNKYQKYLKENPAIELFRYSNIDNLKKHLIKIEYKEEELENIEKFVYENQNVVLEYIDYLKAQRDLIAEWEFIPKGHVDKKETVNNSEISSKTISEQEILRRRMGAINYLESTNYLYRLIGRDKFQGYIGYVYPNGKVVFCQSLDLDKNVKSAAIYVMNYKNFVYLSKKTKTEIIDIIKHDPNEDVHRIFHYEDMKKTISLLDKAISGNDYDENVLEYINNLILTKTLKKKSGGLM